MLLIMGCLSCAAPKYTYDFGQPSAAAVTKTGSRSVEMRPRVPDSIVFEASFHATPNSRPGTQTTLRALDIRQVTVDPGPAIEPERIRNTPPIISESMHPDLERSIVFVAGGATALIIGGEVFVVLGSLSLLIGLIFGIKWLLRE